MPITLIMNHDSLKYMNTVQKPSKRLARWVDEFQQYNLVIKYRPGSQAIVPDAISRRPDFNALVLQNAEDYVSYVRRFLQDHSFSEDASELNKTQIIAKVNKFVLKNEVLHRKMKKRITGPLRTSILDSDACFGSSLGTMATPSARNASSGDTSVNYCQR